jgi:manganese-dependent ADP-ribose/CDP-alcohol diphosphatase
MHEVMKYFLLFTVICPYLLKAVVSIQRTAQPLFKFGLIADIQYANAPDALNFQKTQMRRYRQSLRIYQDAVEYWKEQSKVDFALILGDIIDAKANLDNNQHACLEEVCQIGSHGKFPKYYCFGNHCHYSFTREELRRILVDPVITNQPISPTQSIPASSTSSSTTTINFPRNDLIPYQLFYHWSPCKHWRFIALDAYDISTISPTTVTAQKLAKQWLRDHNPNDLSQSGGWFHNLPREKLRWVPYNGGIGETQQYWLQQVLSAAKLQQEQVIIFCHVPIYAPYRPNSLLWNAEEILEIIQSAGNVVMWMAGHDHGGKLVSEQCQNKPLFNSFSFSFILLGQYHEDSGGIIHFVPPAPIECDEGLKSYGTISVYEKTLNVDWIGKLPNKTKYTDWPDSSSFSIPLKYASIQK